MAYKPHLFAYLNDCPNRSSIIYTISCILIDGLFNEVCVIFIDYVGYLLQATCSSTNRYWKGSWLVPSILYKALLNMNLIQSVMAGCISNLRSTLVFKKSAPKLFPYFSVHSAFHSDWLQENILWRLYIPGLGRCYRYYYTLCLWCVGCNRFDIVCL